MLETVEIDESLIGDQMRDLYIDDRLVYKPIVDDSKKKLAGRIDVLDNYYDRFVTSMPMAIPVKKTFSTSTSIGSYKTSTSVGSGGRITDSIYKYINYSIDNIKKYAAW